MALAALPGFRVSLNVPDLLAVSTTRPTLIVFLPDFALPTSSSLPLPGSLTERVALPFLDEIAVFGTENWLLGFLAGGLLLPPPPGGLLLPPPPGGFSLPPPAALFQPIASTPAR